jgi:hypothetical protein
MMRLDPMVHQSIQYVARFYDEKKRGDIGPLGYRRSSDLTRLTKAIAFLRQYKLLIPGESLFLDMGCADGRVNVLFSYLTKRSIGVELDEWTLDEYTPLKADLETLLHEHLLPLPPDNISLFLGDSMDDHVHETIRQETGVCFSDVDVFYTYLTMQEEFAALIARKAKTGSVFVVYGLDRVIPQFQGLTLLTNDRPLEGILAIYQK